MLLLVLPGVHAIAAEKEAASKSTDSATEQLHDPVAKAVGRNGPFELVVELYEDRIRAGKQAEFGFEWSETLWVRFSIRNIGKDPVPVTAKVFLAYLENPSDHTTYFEVVNSDGELQLGGDFPIFPRRCLYKYYTVVPASPESIAQQRKWMKEGVPDDEIKKRLEEQYRKNAPPSVPEVSVVVLEPGEILNSVPAANLPFDADCNQVDRKPIGPYTELVSFRSFTKPGTYKLRAVYDASISEELQRERSIVPDPEDVKVVTNWIEFRVDP